MGKASLAGMSRDTDTTDFVIAIVAISTFGWVATSWIRARHGYPLENEWSGMSHKADPAADRQVAFYTAARVQHLRVDKMTRRLRHVVGGDPRQCLFRIAA